jgi:hypothetical protein
MTLRIDFTPTEEAWINGQASILGVSPDEVVRRVVNQQLPTGEIPGPVTASATRPVSERNAAAIAYLDARIRAESTTNPEDLLKAAEEYEELKRNLNANRAATGERSVFP